MIAARGGVDQVWGNGGDDVICGGQGRDTLQGGDGLDQIAGQQANDLMDGGVLGCCGPGNTGNDVLWGGQGRDILHASDFGNNTLRGQQGADELHGWQGNDVLEGGNGSDVLDAFTGDDSLSGGNGRDRLDGGPGSDSLNGGRGTDTCANGESNTSCEAYRRPTAQSRQSRTKRPASAGLLPVARRLRRHPGALNREARCRLSHDTLAATSASLAYRQNPPRAGFGTIENQGPSLDEDRCLVLAPRAHRAVLQAAKRSDQRAHRHAEHQRREENAAGDEQQPDGSEERVFGPSPKLSRSGAPGACPVLAPERGLLFAVDVGEAVFAGQLGCGEDSAGLREHVWVCGEGRDCASGKLGGLGFGRKLGSQIHSFEAHEAG